MYGHLEALTERLMRSGWTDLRLAIFYPITSFETAGTICVPTSVWNDTFWLVYDRTSAHSAPDGVVVLMRSADLRRWDEVAVFKTPYDARDAKLRLPTTNSLSSAPTVTTKP